MKANLGLEDVEIHLGDIRRIRDDEVEARVAIGKEIGVDEIDAIFASMANRIAARNFKRFFRYVGRDNSHLRRIHRDRNRDSARTGADVEGEWMLAGREKLQRGVHENFRLRTRDKNGGRHLEIEGEEFLAPDDVGNRLARGTSLDHSAKFFRRIGVDAEGTGY